MLGRVAPTHPRMAGDEPRPPRACPAGRSGGVGDVTRPPEVRQRQTRGLGLPQHPQSARCSTAAVRACTRPAARPHRHGPRGTTSAPPRRSPPARAPPPRKPAHRHPASRPVPARGARLGSRGRAHGNDTGAAWPRTARGSASGCPARAPCRTRPETRSPHGRGSARPSGPAPPCCSAPRGRGDRPVERLLVDLRRPEKPHPVDQPRQRAHRVGTPRIAHQDHPVAGLVVARQKEVGAPDLAVDADARDDLVGAPEPAPLDAGLVVERDMRRCAAGPTSRR
jgi:hypothetical protein